MALSLLCWVFVNTQSYFKDCSQVKLVTNWVVPLVNSSVDPGTNPERGTGRDKIFYLPSSIRD